MVEGSIEFLKFSMIPHDKIEKNFSSIISNNIYYSCYDLAEDDGEPYTCHNTCKGDFKKCIFINDLKKYNKKCWRTPKLVIPDNDFVKTSDIMQWGEISSPLDFDEPFCVEDIIIRRNCNALIAQQKVYRSYKEKMGYVVRVLLSQSIDDNDDCMNGYELMDLYSEDKRRKICIWSPTFKDLFSIMLRNDKNIFLDILTDLCHDINQNTEVLVEKYLENKNDNWTIESFLDDDGEYYFEIDCRALVSLIKQIMICEDELYCESTHRGRFKILDEFEQEYNLFTT